MNAGELRDRVSLERVQGAATAEHPDGQWLPLAATPDVWAAVEPQGDARYRVRLRYRSDLAEPRAIDKGLRVIHGDRLLVVEDIVEADRRKEVHLLCRDAVVETETLSTGGHGIKGETA